MDSSDLTKVIQMHEITWDEVCIVCGGSTHNKSSYYLQMNKFKLKKGLSDFEEYLFEKVIILITRLQFIS